MAKETLVKLTEKKSGDVKEYSIRQAQDLLDLEARNHLSNYELTDSNFTLDDGTIKRTNTGDSKESAEEEPANSSDQK